MHVIARNFPSDSQGLIARILIYTNYKLLEKLSITLHITSKAERVKGYKQHRLVPNPVKS